MARQSWQRQCSSATHHSPAAPGLLGTALTLIVHVLRRGGEWAAWPIGPDLEYEQRPQGRMQGQGWEGLAVGLVVGLAGPPAKSGGGPCETNHKLNTEPGAAPLR